MKAVSKMCTRPVMVPRRKCVTLPRRTQGGFSEAVPGQLQKGWEGGWGNGARTAGFPAHPWMGQDFSINKPWCPLCLTLDGKGMMRCARVRVPYPGWQLKYKANYTQSFSSCVVSVALFPKSFVVFGFKFIVTVYLLCSHKPNDCYPMVVWPPLKIFTLLWSDTNTARVKALRTPRSLF